MTRSRTFIAAAAAALVLAVLPLPSRAETPTFFPDGFTLGSTSYSLRVAGADRYATSGSLAMVAAVNQDNSTGFPFNQPDPGSPQSSYGFAACPKTVALAAGDTVADALAGSSVKDLGLLTVGDQTIDTGDALLLLTTAARQGGTALNANTRVALEALVDAGCQFDGLIFGGENAVPAEAATELDSIAGDVVRIEGSDRYDTAADIAVAVTGSAGLPTVTFHNSRTSRENLPATVFLAEALTGADALAVGAFAAANNVPILLTDTATVPGPTISVLEQLQPDTVIVLGGTGAVSEEAEASAAAAAGEAETRRIAGENRYETSVLIAQNLFGIFPPAKDAFGNTVDPTTHSDQMFGIARSEGRAGDHAGFPDALASAFFLDTAASRTTPSRLAPPVEMQDGSVFIGGAESPGPAPLLLTARGEEPEEVADYLASLYDEDDIKTAEEPEAENHGGFAFVFGGTGAVSAEVELAVAGQLSGGTYLPDEVVPSDVAPVLDQGKAFYTGMEWPLAYTSSDGPGFDAEGATLPGDKLCVLRGAVAGSQFLRRFVDGDYASATTVDYEDEDTTFPEFESRNQCLEADGSTAAVLDALSPSGHDTSDKPFDWSDPSLLLSTPVPGFAPETPPESGSANIWTDQSSIPVPGGSKRATYRWQGSADFVFRGTTYADANFTATVEFTRTDAGGDDRITFAGTIEVRSGGTFLFRVSVDGESATIESPLRLVGSYTLGTKTGGFRATINKNADTTDASLSDLVLDGLA